MNETALLGRKDSEAMGFTKLVPAVVTGSELTLTNLNEYYPANFEGQGLIIPDYDMKVDKSVPDVVQATHRIPYPKREKLKSTLATLKKQGIVADVDRSTEWVSNLVIAEKKNGTIRLCLDPKDLNRAIRRKHIHIPTPEEVQTN